MGDRPKTLKEEIWQWRDAAIDCAELKSSTAWVVAVLSTKMKPYQPWLVNVGQLAKWAKLSRKSAGQHLQLAVKAGFLRVVEKPADEGKPGRLHAVREYAPCIPKVPADWDHKMQWREGVEAARHQENLPDPTSGNKEADMRRQQQSKEPRYFIDRNGQERPYDKKLFQDYGDHLRTRGKVGLPDEAVEFYEEMKYFRESRAWRRQEKKASAELPVPEGVRGVIDCAAGEAWHKMRPALRGKHGDATYNSYLRPIVVLEALPGSAAVVLAVPTHFMQKFIMKHYLDDIKQAWAEVGRPEVELVAVKLVDA